MTFTREGIDIDKNGNSYEAYFFMDKHGNEHAIDQWLMKLNVFISQLNPYPLPIKKMEEFATKEIEE